MRKIKIGVIIVIVLIIVLSLVYTGLSIKNRFNPSVTITTSSKTVIKELRSLNRLETASYTIEKVVDAGIKGNAFQEFLYGDRILLIAHGEVIAGVDLSQLKDDDIKVEGSSVTLTLPPPVVLVTKLDSAQTRIYDRKQGILSRGNKDLESQARLAAEETIQEAACQGEILREAANNARRQLTALLKALGFVTITIVIPEASC